MRYKIKRLRRVVDAKGVPTGSEYWVEVGKAFVAPDGESGSIMLNDRDEVWRMFPDVKKERKP